MVRIHSWTILILSLELEIHAEVFNPQLQQTVISLVDFRVDAIDELDADLVEHDVDDETHQKDHDADHQHMMTVSRRTSSASGTVTFDWYMSFWFMQLTSYYCISSFYFNANNL